MTKIWIIMFKNKVILVLFVFGIVGIMYYSLSGSESYADTVVKQRDEFLHNLMEEKDSPIAGLKDFSGIRDMEINNVPF